MTPPPRSGSNRSKNQRNRRQGPKRQPVDLWRHVPELAVPEPIRPSSHPPALLDSLGPPPLPDRPEMAAQYLAVVIERAAMLASALASSAGLLLTDDSDDE